MRRGEVVRQLARDNYDVNDAWLCDKGRFAFRFPDAPERITTPLIRDRGLEPASFGEVLTRIAEWTDGTRVAILTGGRLMDEDYYALSKLARTVLPHERPRPPPWRVARSTAERRRRGRPDGRDLQGRRDARRRSWSWASTPSRRCRSCTCACARPRGAAPRSGCCTLAGPVCTTSRPTCCVRRATRAGCWRAGSIRISTRRSPRCARRATRGVVHRRRARRRGRRRLDGRGRRAVPGSPYVTRRANDRGALRAGVHPALLPGGRTHRRGPTRSSARGAR